MKNETSIWLAVGILLLVIVITGLYWPKTGGEVQNPTPAVIENVACGSVVLPETMSLFAADGPDGLVTVKLDNGIGQLAVGQYRVSLWQTERKDNEGNTWTLTGRESGSTSPFKVTDGGQINLDIGEPIVATVHASRIGPSSYSFSQSLQGRHDEHVTLTRNGARPGAPKLRIKNKDGTYDRTFAFRYG